MQVFKKIFPVFISILLSVSLMAQPENIQGTWEGILHVGAELRIVFHFTENADGSISATMDSPDQKVFGLPCSEVKILGDSVLVRLDIAKAHYDGAFVNDTMIHGTWFQGPGNHPLSLTKESKNKPDPKPERPQTPQPPFPYLSEDVIYWNADSSIQYGATFTSPKTGVPLTVALLITGSGQQDRDETVFDHKPFAVIADFLTRQGFAVLRVDDRGIGKTTGTLTNTTSLDFADDVISGIHYLLQRTDVDKNKIGLIGHSEGGLIAPIVYTKWPRLAFIISLAGPGVTGADILLRQQTDPLKGLVSDSAFNAFYLLTQNKFKLILENKNQPDSTILEKIEQYFASWKNAVSPQIQAALNIQDVTPAEYAKAVALELKPWLKYFLITDPSLFWDKVKCPVLALNGEKDIQVYAAQNIPAIEAALAKAGNKSVTTKIFPGLNHLFQHCTRCTVEEYGKIAETFSPEALAAMADWLHKTIQ